MTGGPGSQHGQTGAEGNHQPCPRRPPGHLRPPPAAAVLHAGGDAVDEVIEVDGRDLVGAGAKVDHITVAQTQRGDRAFVIERCGAETLQDPATVQQSGVGQVVAQVVQQRRL